MYIYIYIYTYIHIIHIMISFGKDPMFAFEMRRGIVEAHFCVDDISIFLGQTFIVDDSRRSKPPRFR